MKKNKLISIIGLLVFVMLVGGVSYSYFVYNRDIAEISLNTGDISIDLSNINGNMNLTDVVPMNDHMGKISTEYMDFTVNATADTEPILYEVEIIPKVSNTLDSQYVKVYLTDQQNNVILSPFLYTELVNIENNNGKVLYQEMISSSYNETTAYTKNFRLRIWIDEDYPEVTSKTFAFDINLHAYNVDGSKYKKVIFNTQDERVGLSKYVAVGEGYGYLPTPTREGYTFMGWNGKNLVKPLSTQITLNGVTVTPQSDGSIVLNGIKQSDSNYYGTVTDVFYVKAGVQYFVSIGSYNVGVISNYGLQGFASRKSIRNAVDYRSGGIQLYINNGIVLSNVKLYPQIEEGTVATAYEPYYVDNTVTVTQEKDHVLKAIWLENN